ncbi:NUDIX hydrolase [Parvularcula oceani]|uniref:NUDIX hydrolase n=1 Tax=Parvularcula oceani TaxID=1247963 RepID=UPI00068F9EFD|nr:CoA pyrophosphatase [Parvularcula oceani]
MMPDDLLRRLRAAPDRAAANVDRRLFEALNPTMTHAPILDKPPERYRPASVLIPVIDRPEPTVLFTVRTPTMPSHAGQISFPGGGPRVEDVDEIDTALRETEEEVGVGRDHIEVLGRLGLHYGGMGYVVTPVIGLVHVDAETVPCPREVAEIFEVPLAHLADRRNHITEERHFNGIGYQMYAVPYEERNGSVRHIWGLTAGILETFCRALNDDPLPESAA